MRVHVNFQRNLLLRKRKKKKKKNNNSPTPFSNVELFASHTYLHWQICWECCVILLFDPSGTEFPSQKKKCKWKIGKFNPRPQEAYLHRPLRGKAGETLSGSGISWSSKAKSVFSKIPSLALPTLSHLIVMQWRSAVLSSEAPNVLSNMSNMWYLTDSFPTSQTFYRETSHLGGTPPPPAPFLVIFYRNHAEQVVRFFFFFAVTCRWGCLQSGLLSTP